ncbi:MAG: hypothetical protein EB006_08140 [Betaproteobacteria bacterium]|nr:hypothetical protein [Betaproteobacteria bacterium]
MAHHIASAAKSFFEFFFGEQKEAQEVPQGLLRDASLAKTVYDALSQKYTEFKDLTEEARQTAVRIHKMFASAYQHQIFISLLQEKGLTERYKELEHQEQRVLKELKRLHNPGYIFALYEAGKREAGHRGGRRRTAKRKTRRRN